MRNPYEVCLWDNRYMGSAKIIATRRFKNLHSARKWAYKLRNKHCIETRYTCYRPKFFVDIYKAKQGCVEELEPLIFPSVGELGYTP